jgi:hypothetical protein
MGGVTMKVCMGTYAGGELAVNVVTELGFAFDKETQTYPIKEMTKVEMLTLAERVLDMGAGVMIQHPYPRKKKDKNPSPWDYLIYVDSPKGRFRQR